MLRPQFVKVPDEEIWDGNDLTADAAVVAPDAVEVEAEFWATQQFVPVYVSLSCELSSLCVQERGMTTTNCALLFRVCVCMFSWWWPHQGHLLPRGIHQRLLDRCGHSARPCGRLSAAASL